MSRRVLITGAASGLGLALAKANGFSSLRELRALPATALLKGGGGPTYATPVYPQNYPTALQAGKTDRSAGVVSEF